MYGTIGAGLGVLTRLTGLYLNDNELSGTIPPELENLVNLQVFDVRNTGLSCVTPGSELHTWLATIDFRGAVCATRPPRGGGGGGPRTSAPGAPRNLTVVGGEGEVVLTWDAPKDDGGSSIRDYEYRINGKGRWISIGSTDTTHTVTGLVNGTAYVFEVRAVNRIGESGASDRVEATLPWVMNFAHFANGADIISDLVFVNVATHPIHPALYFYDKEGHPIAPESVVDVTVDLEVTEDGSLSVSTEMEPLGVLTISTHGQGELVSGSVKVVSDGPLGGVVRFDLPGIGVAGVGASEPVRDVLFPARRQAGGIRTAAALYNLGAEPMGVRRPLPGAPPGGRNHDGSRAPQPGIESGVAALRLDAGGRAARRREHPSGGQRADGLVHRPGVPRRRYVRLRGVGALRCGRGGAVQRRGPGNGPRQPHLHHPAGGAGSREDVSGIDKGRDPVVQGLSRGREGGVIRRDEGGAQRFDVPVVAAGSAFRVLPSKRGKSIAVCGCLVLRGSI